LAILILEAHALSVIQKYLEIRPGLTWRLDGLMRDVHGAIDVGETARLLAPLCTGQYNVGDGSSLGHEDILCNDKQVILGEKLAHASKVW
jgi:hypothetical protein